jgi:sialate O-acetylesterase
MRFCSTMLLLCLVLCQAAEAMTIASPFSDHGVLQRDQPLPVWGTARPFDTLIVRCGSQTRTVQADSHGEWTVTFDPMSAGGPPVELSVTGSSVIILRNLVVGEVWICSGQSNMEWPVSAALDADREIRAADLPDIRLFTVGKRACDAPRATCDGTWVVCSPASVPVFSAVAYYFGRHLHRELGVPIGLINVSWSGTPAEAWTSRVALSRHRDLEGIIPMWDKRMNDHVAALARHAQEYDEWLDCALARSMGRSPPLAPRAPKPPDASHRPGGLREGMITPLIPYAIRGAIWYQGEANAARAKQYRSLLPVMIGDWRQAWGQGDFPFYFVQLANLHGRNWPEMREVQSLVAQHVPNTGMAVTIDIGERDNVHPRNKQEVGRRLALIALARTYGQPLASSGPVVAEARASGATVVVSFTHDDGGLIARGDQLTGFEIAGPDGVFLPAEAVISGARVVLSHAQVGMPSVVRYAWADDPICSLFNGAGLPAGPFRRAVTPVP